MWTALLFIASLKLTLCCICYTSATQIYTLSLHDALPISSGGASGFCEGMPLLSKRRANLSPTASHCFQTTCAHTPRRSARKDRKSTRLNSSHVKISYAVFCLKKKKLKYTAVDGRDLPEIR